MSSLFGHFLIQEIKLFSLIHNTAYAPKAAALSPSPPAENEIGDI